MFEFVNNFSIELCLKRAKHKPRIVSILSLLYPEHLEPIKHSLLPRQDIQYSVCEYPIIHNNPYNELTNGQLHEDGVHKKLESIGPNQNRNCILV